MSNTPILVGVKVRMSFALTEKASMYAKECGWSRNTFIVRAVRDYVRQFDANDDKLARKYRKDAAKRCYRVSPKEAERIIGAELTKAEQAAKRRTKEK